MLALSIVARLPLAMFSIALLVHTQRLTGSFAAAGLVTAAYAIAVGIGGPLLGRMVDRRGQTAVLAVTASVSASLSLAVALLPAGVALPVLIVLAAGIGLATPPVGACVRTLLKDPRAFAVEASAVELAWVFGPPLALGAGAIFSTGAALAGAGAVLLAGTVGFALHPASRAWRPSEPSSSRPRGGSLRAPAVRTLVLVMGAVGAIFGATEIGVTAATESLGSTAAAGPLLGVWGAGSLLGGVWLARRGGVAPLRPLLLALAVGHAALAFAAFDVFVLAALLLLAGAAIAPTYAVVYSLVEKAAPAGALTEAFAWLATAISVGAALGAALAGPVADTVGPVAVFGLAGAAGVAALIAISGTGSRVAAGVAR
jgi:predicted MFS family arabinose efflux permease